MKRILLASILCIALLFALCSCELGGPKLTYEENSDGGYTVTGMGNSKATEIVIPATYQGKPVTAIGANAFMRNALADMLSKEEIPEITSVTLPDSITTIGSGAFQGNKKLIVNMPASLKTIGANAFNGCEALTTVALPESVTEIGNGAFQSCFALTSVTLPNSVTKIPASCFSGCSSLASFTISDKITTIDDYAFASCTSLGKLTIPTTVTTLGTAVFQGSSKNLEVSVSYDEATPEGWDDDWTYKMNGKVINTSQTFHDNVIVPNQTKAIELEAKIKACNDRYNELQAEMVELNEASKPYQASGNQTMIKHYRDEIQSRKAQQSAIINQRIAYQEELDALVTSSQIYPLASDAETN